MPPSMAWLHFTSRLWDDEAEKVFWIGVATEGIGDEPLGIRGANPFSAPINKVGTGMDFHVAVG